MFVSLPKRQAAQQRLWPVEGLRLFEVLERINASSQSKPLEATEEDWGAGEGELMSVILPLLDMHFTLLGVRLVSHTGGLAQVYQPLTCHRGDDAISCQHRNNQFGRDEEETQPVTRV